jgi:hypothetical protein
MMRFGKFAVLNAAVALMVLAAATTRSYADAIPYPNAGTIITNSGPIVATGGTTLYFYGFSAADSDYVNVIDTTNGQQTGLVFLNQITPVGTAVGLVTSAGDNLVIQLYNVTTNSYFYSGDGVAPSGFAAATENVNHAYVTPYTVSVNGIPAPGLYLGMEDLAAGAQGGDYDYNDDQFVITGAAPTPEPSSLMLMGTGLMSAAGMVIRRRRSIA